MKRILFTLLAALGLLVGTASANTSYPPGWGYNYYALSLRVGTAMKDSALVDGWAYLDSVTARYAVLDSLDVGSMTGTDLALTGELKLTEAPGAHEASPTLQFGDGDTGFYESTDDKIYVSVGGVATFGFDSNYIGAIANGYAVLRDRNPTATSPNIMPDMYDANTGIGAAGSDQLSLIVGAVEGLRVTEAAAAITVSIPGALTVTGAVSSDSLNTRVAMTESGIFLADDDSLRVYSDKFALYMEQDQSLTPGDNDMSFWMIEEDGTAHEVLRYNEGLDKINIQEDVGISGNLTCYTIQATSLLAFSSTVSTMDPETAGIGTLNSGNNEGDIFKVQSNDYFTVDGVSHFNDNDVTIETTSGSSNSPYLYLNGDFSGTTERGAFKLVYGEDPYLEISVDDTFSLPALTPALHIHDDALSLQYNILTAGTKVAEVRDAVSNVTYWSCTITHDSVYAAATAEDILLIDDFPAKYKILEIFIDVTELWDGVLMSACNVSAGWTGALYNDLIDREDINSGATQIGDAAGELNYTAVQSGIRPSWSSIQDIYLRFGSTGDNLSNLTTGEMTVYITYQSY